MDADPSARDDRRFEWQVVLDEADYRAMARAYAKRQQGTRLNNGFGWGKAVIWVALTLILIAVFNVLDSDIAAVAFAGFLAGVFALWVALLLYNRMAMPKMIERLSGTAVKTFDVTMDSAGIVSTRDIDSLRVSWTGIVDVDETETHYFMWPNSLYALVLPKRVLRDADETARFKQALKDWTGGK